MKKAAPEPEGLNTPASLLGCRPQNSVAGVLVVDDCLVQPLQPSEQDGILPGVCRQVYECDANGCV